LAILWKMGTVGKPYLLVKKERFETEKGKRGSHCATPGQLNFYGGVNKKTELNRKRGGTTLSKGVGQQKQEIKKAQREKSVEEKMKKLAAEGPRMGLQTKKTAMSGRDFSRGLKNGSFWQEKRPAKKLHEETEGNNGSKYLFKNQNSSPSKSPHRGPGEKRLWHLKRGGEHDSIALAGPSMGK